MVRRIESIFREQVSCLHPDTIIEIPFSYVANLDTETEEVEVLSVSLIDNGELVPLRITGNDTALNQFLASIREHARVAVYKSSQNDVPT